MADIACTFSREELVLLIQGMHALEFDIDEIDESDMVHYKEERLAEVEAVTLKLINAMTGVYRYLEEIKAGFYGEKPPFSSEHDQVLILLERIRNVLNQSKDVR